MLLENAGRVFLELPHRLEHLRPGAEPVEESADVGPRIVQAIANRIGERQLDLVDALDRGDQAFTFQEGFVETVNSRLGERVVGLRVIAIAFWFGSGFRRRAGVRKEFAHRVRIVARQLAFPPTLDGQDRDAVTPRIFGLRELVRLAIELPAALARSFSTHAGSRPVNEVSGYQFLNGGHACKNDEGLENCEKWGWRKRFLSPPRGGLRVAVETL